MSRDLTAHVTETTDPPNEGETFQVWAARVGALSFRLTVGAQWTWQRGRWAPPVGAKNDAFGSPRIVL